MKKLTIITLILLLFAVNIFAQAEETPFDKAVKKGSTGFRVREVLKK